LLALNNDNISTVYASRDHCIVADAQGIPARFPEQVEELVALPVFYCFQWKARGNTAPAFR